METVYKFCGAFGADVLRHLELKVTPPSQFNDPFEFTPRIVYSDPLAYASRALSHSHVQKTLYDMLILDGKFVGSFSDFQNTCRERMTEWTKILAEAPEYTTPLVEMEFQDSVSMEWGILCMSQRRDSILMWGHYCDKPLGLVIGFNRSSAIFQQAKAMRPVNYVKERVIFDACWELGSPELADYENRIIFSKGEEWSYEQELRQAFQLRDLLRRPIGGAGAFGYFLPVPPDAITSVTLGPRSSSEHESYIREILQHSPLLAGRRVALDRTCLEQATFSLRFEPIL